MPPANSVTYSKAMNKILRKIATALRIFRLYFSKSPELASIQKQNTNAKVLDVVIHAHIYNDNYLKKLTKGIKNFPEAMFLISVPNLDIKQRVLEIFQTNHKQRVKVEIVPNRGRNFGPMLNVFSEEILSHEILVHIHSKASNGMLFRFFWSNILWRDLYLSKKRVRENFQYFSDPKLGVLATFTLGWTPPVFSWGGSFEKAQKLFPEITYLYDDAATFLYPIGGMFWARVSSIQPLFEKIESYKHFPEEANNLKEIQSGQTTEHVVERLIGLFPETLGFNQIVRVHERRKTITAKEFISKLVVSQNMLRRR